MPSFNEFAMFNAPEDNRLNIRVCNIGEKIFYGFGSVRNGSNNIKTDVIYRIKDPNGNIVAGPSPVPTAGNGYIPNYTQAVIGPNTLFAGGYTPLTLIPSVVGDYYIEFDFTKPYNAERRVFDFIDFTVSSPLNTRIDGRLWSKTWHLTVGNFQNTFNGKMYIYADDGIVTSVTFRDLQPYVFTISANETGCNNTGNFYTDRMSVDGLHTYPQYKIFLNNPDEGCFPSGTFGNLLSQTYITGCPGNYCINIEVDKEGNIEILLDLNGIAGYQPNSADVVLNCFVHVGSNCIFWDGLDGLGNVVANNTNVLLEVNYFNGLTHLPMYDVETNVNGFRIKVERPYTPDSIPPTFWDDSNIPGGTVEFTGCVNPLGCHAWICTGNCENDPISLGNYRTINTWWYANVVHDNFQHNYMQALVDANVNTPIGTSNDTSICIVNNPRIQLNGWAEYVSGVYWTGGTGIFLPNNTVLDAIYQFSAEDIQNGIVTFTLNGIPANGCPMVQDFMIVHVNNMLTAVSPDKTICYGESTELNAAGGNLYHWNNNENTSSIIVSPNINTTYIVTISHNNGCSVVDSVVVFVNPLPIVNLGDDRAICYGQLFNLDAGVGVSYIWNNGSTTASIDVVALNNTTYQVTVTDINGCKGTDDINIFVNPLPNAHINEINPVCQGSLANLTATGGIEYIWSNGDTTNQIAIQPLTNTVYSVTVTNENGCTASDFVVVQVLALPNADAGIDRTVCYGDKVRLKASGGSNYTWSNGESTAMITVVAMQTEVFTVTVTDENSCSSTDEVLITVNPLPEANAGSDIIVCKNTFVNLFAEGGESYVWNNGINANTNTVFITTPTYYTVTVTNEYGCSASDKVFIDIYPDFEPIIQSSPQVCKGDSTEIKVFGGNSYTWSNGVTSNSIVVTINNPLIYTVTVTDANGCYKILETLIKPLPLPNANAGDDITICYGEYISITATGGNQYFWNNGETDNIITVNPLTTTQYIVTVTNQFGCSASDEVLVYVNPLPNADAGSNINICRNQPAILTATGGSSYLWNIGLNVNIIVVYPQIPTNYTVTVTNEFGCTASDEVFVNIYPDVNPVITYNQQVCSGESTVIEVSGGVDYIWSNGNTGNQITIVPLANTTYTVTVTDANGCTATEEAFFNVLSLPYAIAGNDVSVCKGTDVILTGNGGSLYAWSNGSNEQQIEVSPLTTATYTVTVTDNNGCSNTDDVVVTVYPLPIAHAGNDQFVCLNSYTQFYATGGVNYQWSNGMQGAVINVLAVANATYTVTVTDLNGCSATDDIQISVLPIPQAFAGEDKSICAGESTQLTGSGGEMYVWNTGAVTQQIIVSPITNTTYTVTVTNHYGCSASGEASVTVYPIPNPNAGSDTSICQNTTLSIVASGGNSYIWNNGSSSNILTVTPLISQYYTVTVSNNFGCSASDEVYVQVNPIPNADAGTAPSVCFGESLVLNASGGITYIWNNGMTGQSIVVNPQYEKAFEVTVTDANGCTASDRVIVDIKPLPDVNAGADQTICSGTTVTLQAIGGVSYLWNNGQSGNTINVTPNITTSYVVTASNSYGCRNVDTIIVFVNYMPTATAGADITICNGDEAQLQASGGYTYSWIDNGTISDISIANPIVHPTATTTYSVIISNEMGCTIQDEVVVTVKNNPIASAGPDVWICPDETVTLVATGGRYYEWSNGETLPIIRVTPSYSTFYQVLVTDQFGCTATDEVFVGVKAIPNIQISSNLLSACMPATVQLSINGYNANEISSFIWNFDDNLSNDNINTTDINPIHVYNAEGTYLPILTVLSSTGCIVKKSVLSPIVVHGNPIADFQYKIYRKEDGNVKIQLYNESYRYDSVYWDFGIMNAVCNQHHITNPIIQAKDAGSFIVTLYVSNKNGCYDTISRVIQFNPPHTIFVPNAFTPDADGLNDIFRVYGTNISKEGFKLYVFDRWGEQIFESADIESGWDGSVKGRVNNATTGAYAWLCIYYDLDGRQYKKVGSVTIIR